MVTFFLLLLTEICQGRLSPDKPPRKFEADGNYEVLYFEERVDHINRDPGYFNVKVLLRRGDMNAPLFVYTGNEGPIEEFFKMTGWLVNELGPKYNATVAFIEHRYYGESQIVPFTWKYLSSSQALWDFADITQQLKLTEQTPVIAFGGSYGGMLSAFFRLKYPHIVDGAIASSAPVLMAFNSGKGYANITSQDYYDVTPYCASNITSGFEIIENLMQRPSTYSLLTSKFRTCQQITQPVQVRELEDWLTDALMTMAQFDYPYPADVAGSLPANPVNVACSIIAEYGRPPYSFQNILEGLYKVANLYYNSTGDVQCFDIYSAGRSVGQTWEYQTCTEFLMPIGQYGPPNDMFPKRPWNEEMWSNICMAKYGVKPRNSWERITYGMTQDIRESLKYASNIVFSYGTLDPWKTGCIQEDINDETLVIGIKGGAHHLDLRTPNPYDPQSVRFVRSREESEINKWITQKAAKYSN
mgnify:FL=1